MFATTPVPTHYLKKPKELLLLEREGEISFFFSIYLFILFFSCLSSIGYYINDDWNGNLPDSLWSRAQVIPETFAQCFIVTTSGVTLESIFA